MKLLFWCADKVTPKWCELGIQLPNYEQCSMVEENHDDDVKTYKLLHGRGNIKCLEVVLHRYGNFGIFQ